MKYVYLMHPGNRLRELRKRAHISQAELARLAGISQPAISQVENDERPLTVDWMRTFGRILNCAPADFLGDQDMPYRLSDDEKALIAQFREADHAQRKMIQRVAEPITQYPTEVRDIAA